MGNPAGGPAMNDTRALYDYEIKLLEDVEQFGCHVISVVDPDGNAPPFSYSVGFSQTFGQGEVIVIGLVPEDGHWVINDLKEKIRFEDFILADNLRIPEILSECDLMCRSIPAERIVRDYFNSALWFHDQLFKKPLTTAFQLVWPDPVGFYPWDDQCDSELLALQTPLYEPRLNS